VVPFNPFSYSYFVHRRIRGLDGPLIKPGLLMQMEDLWVEEE